MKRRKSLHLPNSLRFLNTWWSVTHFRVCKSHCEPVRTYLLSLWVRLRGCLRCFWAPPHNRLENLIYLRCGCCCCCCWCRSIVASFLFSNSIFSFTFQFLFSLYFFFLFLSGGQLQIFCHLLLLLPCFVLVCKKGLAHVPCTYFGKLYRIMEAFYTSRILYWNWVLLICEIFMCCKITIQKTTVYNF